MVPKSFWLEKSDEKNSEVEVQIEAHDGRRFTRSFRRVYQRNKPHIYCLDIDQEILDHTGIEIAKHECLVQLIEPTLIKISKLENGRGGGKNRVARKAVKRRSAEETNYDEDDSDEDEQEEYVETQFTEKAGRGRPTGRGRTRKKRASPSRSPSPAGPVIVGVGTNILIVSHYLLLYRLL